jgi:hypothetical protein
MKYILSSLFGINIFISLICIISNGIWIHYNDIYITTSQFGFYLSVSFISLLLSILYLTLRYNCNKNEIILNNVAFLLSFFMTILWMAASICITLLTKDCLQKGYECRGTIVNISFGFINLFIWVSILWITLYRFLNITKRYPALEAQASDEISRERRHN